MVIPLTLLMVYHSFNVYLDVRYRITKNIWHILFFLIGTVVYVMIKAEWIQFFSICILALIFGLALEALRVSAAGDTKMCIVTSVWIGIFTQESAYVTVVSLYIGYLLFILLASYAILVMRKGVKWVLMNQFYDFRSLVLRIPLSQEKALERFPGAVAICIASILSAFYVVL